MRRPRNLAHLQIYGILIGHICIGRDSSITSLPHHSSIIDRRLLMVYDNGSQINGIQWTVQLMKGKWNSRRNAMEMRISEAWANLLFRNEISLQPDLSSPQQHYISHFHLQRINLFLLPICYLSFSIICLSTIRSSALPFSKIQRGQPPPHMKFNIQPLQIL